MPALTISLNVLPAFSSLFLSPSTLQGAFLLSTIFKHSQVEWDVGGPFGLSVELSLLDAGVTFAQSTLISSLISSFPLPEGSFELPDSIWGGSILLLR
ncbi:hypothetical protein PISMIDRAFT_13050 [Pisolithus microcarpus 441]|uniref:Uncharacterized protein n=1 Tax=Pisolithus microcarpus 441 TaxID=765257 RepID=A0A0C9ZD44_9AGAM|nr:hypothetical protein PISMIDRAFT_13050 [Pisolithus microcarpus 441]